MAMDLNLARARKSIRNQRRMLIEEAAVLAEMEDRLNQFQEDKWDNLTVLRFTNEFDNGVTYNYAALKVDCGGEVGARWFVTGGAKKGSYLTWAELVTNFLGNAENLQHATGWAYTDDGIIDDDVAEIMEDL